MGKVISVDMTPEKIKKAKKSATKGNYKNKELISCEPEIPAPGELRKATPELVQKFADSAASIKVRAIKPWSSPYLYIIFC